MKKVILSNYFTCLVVGGASFWACFRLVKFVAGTAFDGRHVRFLTLFTPFITCLLIWVWHRFVLPQHKKMILTAIFMGIIGPLVMTYIYALAEIAIPAARMGTPFSTIKDYLSFIGSFAVLGPISVLTYSGMLGAIVVNIISSTFMGVFLSKRRKERSKDRGR